MKKKIKDRLGGYATAKKPTKVTAKKRRRQVSVESPVLPADTGVIADDLDSTHSNSLEVLFGERQVNESPEYDDSVEPAVKLHKRSPPSEQVTIKKISARKRNIWSNRSSTTNDCYDDKNDEDDDQNFRLRCSNDAGLVHDVSSYPDRRTSQNIAEDRLAGRAAQPLWADTRAERTSSRHSLSEHHKVNKPGQ